MQGLCRSGFAGAALAPRRTAVRARPVTAAGRGVAVYSYQAEYKWLEKEPLVVIAGLGSWFAATNVPVSAFGNKSLFGLFTESIVEELGHWPVGPALTDSFWLYLVLWHTGLFLVLFLGQIGVQGRKQGYFN